MIGFQCAEDGGSSQQLGPQLRHNNSSVEGRTGVCIPCVFGQHCPSGSFLPRPGSKASQQYVEKYRCRPSFYCPTPAVEIPCPPGAWCSQATVVPTTCEYPVLMKRFPDMTIPDEPLTVVQRVYAKGEPLGGNICPPMSTTPKTPCPSGFYCPNATAILPCPAGRFCKWWTKVPRGCPWLAKCPAGSASADISLGGFFALFLILLLLWLAYVAFSAYIKLQQERLIKKQSAKEKLRRLVAPLLGVAGQGSSLAFKAFSSIRPRISLRFEGIGVTLRDGTVILDSVNGHFSHSKVVAIMGPSGAGKSTLLYALMGTARYGSTRGRLWINGREMRLARLRRILGYVPQDDIVHEDLTVRENLSYSAKLRCMATEGRAYLSDVVDDVIELLGLRHVQHSVVGSVEKRGVSGGQRKRVNIGLELVARPSVLFMDEPTSGLDATAATDILTSLRRMADLGMNIVTVIHQPRYSVFSLFHEVLLLGKAGRTAFQGASSAALPYFVSIGFELPPNENPADFFLDIVSGCVPCHANPDFKPEDLYGIWEELGGAWAETAAQEAIAGAPETAEAVPELSPQQLQLVQEQFDRVDRERTGNITPEAINAFLADVGLEATPFDMRHIMTELDPTHTGVVSRSAFISFIRHGGQPPAPPQQSKYERVLSIEEGMDVHGNPLHAAGSAPAASSSAADRSASGAASCSEGSTASQQASQRGTGAFASNVAQSRASHDEESALVGRPKGLSPSNSQQLELDDALASTADLDGPCDGPDKHAGCLKRLCLPCLHCCGAWWHFWLCGWRSVCGRKKTRYRAIPGTLGQFNLLVRRAGVKWVRNWGVKFLDVCMFAGAALIIGAVHGTSWELEEVRGNAVKTMLTLAAISTVASLQVFGKDRLIFWRESASGLRTGAFFFGHQVMHLIDIVVQPAIFMSVYYTLTLPEIKFINYYIISLGVTWYTSGLGYVMSVMLEQQNSMVASVAVCLVLGGFFNGIEPRFRTLSSFMKVVFGISFSRWSTEATTMEEFRQYPHYMQPRIHKMMQEIGYCGLDKQSLGAGPDAGSLDVEDYCKGYLSWDFLMIFLQGVILRAATFLVLRYGSQLGRVSLFKFFTFCWLRISHSSRQRWASLRRRTSSFGGESPMAPAAQAINPAAQPLLQSDPGHA
ncbi:probable broad substrate specificity ATP-binding cassette transporter at N-terminal half [Coccomyxa sp. Obi]|nr:probable broad substrate specificity ATP-binding cassette transporter at N-terminal half [Coccomyxa sp. Obi]